MDSLITHTEGQTDKWTTKACHLQAKSHLTIKFLVHNIWQIVTFIVWQESVPKHIIWLFNFYIGEVRESMRRRPEEGFTERKEYWAVDCSWGVTSRPLISHISVFLLAVTIDHHHQQYPQHEWCAGLVPALAHTVSQRYPLWRRNKNKVSIRESPNLLSIEYDVVRSNQTGDVEENPLRVLDKLLRGYDRRSTPSSNEGAPTTVWTELYIASLGSINTENMVSTTISTWCLESKDSTLMLTSQDLWYKVV